MALFKIEKGLAANLALNRPKANEGWAYFTTDDGKFYIDIAGDGTQDAVVGTNRICLNSAKADIAVAANKLTVNGGGPTQPIYFKNGVPTPTNYYIEADIDTGIANKLAYYSGANGISAYDATIGTNLTPVYINDGAPTVSVGQTIPFIIGTGSTAGTWLGSLTGITTYYDGLLILYKPSVAGASTTTLNLNNLGAKTVYINNTTKLTTHFPANQPILLVYSANQNSGCWMAIDNYWANSDTYTSAYCGTGASTAAKVATCTQWTATPKSYIHINFRYANTTHNALTLNINSTGAKPIYINGVASSNSNYTLPAGSYLAYYDGTNYHLRTDGLLPGEGITGNATTATSFSSGTTVTLTGDTTGTSASSTKGWSVPTKTDRLSTEGDNRAVATVPNDYVNKLIFRGLKTNSSFGSPSTDNYSYVIGLRGWADSNGGHAHELAFNNTGIFWRNGATTSWGNWNRLVVNSGTWEISISGNADTATEFASAQSVTLTGDVTGTASSQAGWSIATTIGAGKVTNAMLAGSITNAKLVNSKITIAGNDVSLGGSLTADTLRNSLGLSTAMHFIGKATVAITDGSTTNPTITGYDFANERKPGDVIIDEDDSYEFVWTNAGKWERLGPDGSYKVVQTAITDSTGTSESTTATRFVYSVSQDANGVISVKTRPLPTYNNYSLPLAANGTRGGIQIGYSSSGKNYAVQLSSEKAYVNVPWTDTLNTAGSTDTSSKIFLIGATSQANNSQTYSDNEVYATSGVLTAKTFNSTSLTASQAVSTDASKNLVSTNLTVSDPSASGTGITYIASISQSAVGKITATKSTVRSASTSQTGVVQLNDAINSTSTAQAATANAVKKAYDLANDHKYWANIEATSAASYDKAPEMATIKLNGDTSATAASTKNVTLQYDATTETLNFVFA